MGGNSAFTLPEAIGTVLKSGILPDYSTVPISAQRSFPGRRYHTYLVHRLCPARSLPFRNASA